MKTIKSSPVLQTKASSGRLKFWQGYILRSEEDNGSHFTQSASWQELQDGSFSKKMLSEPYYAQPMNVGKANERDSEAQAELEFNAMVKKQRDSKRYREASETAVERVAPMLAYKYSDHANKVVFPCYVQPKFDGNRMLVGGGEQWSRGNQDFIPEVLAHLNLPVDMGWVLDGELMLPGNVPLQRTMSAIKKFHAGISDTLVYMVYDIANSLQPFEARYEALENLFATIVLKGGFVQLTPTYLVRSETELEARYAEFLAQGFEGIMVRTSQGLYKAGQKSKDLLKLKPTDDAEFEIIDVVPMGGGSAATLGKLKLVTASGEEFTSNANGDEAYRRSLLANPKAVIGKWATITFQTLTDRGVPQFPRATNIRDRSEF